MAFPPDSPLTATALATAAVSVGLASLVWWRRLERLNLLRRQVSAIRQLSREIVHAPDPASAAARMEDALRRILRDPALKAALSLPGDGPAAEFRAQKRLEFPLYPDHREKGILLVGSDNELELHPEVREALADLAQHAALALEIREQKHLKDQVARGEQLAAASLLMSGIARELRPLLESMAEEGRRSERESVASEAEAALGLVDRLAALGQRDVARPAVFDLAEAAGELCRFRRHAWRLQQMEVQTRFSGNPLPVRAPRALFEEAVLGLLVAAEQWQQESPAPALEMAAEARGGQAVFSLTAPAPQGSPEMAAEAAAAARGLVESCGGEFEEQRAPGRFRFEMRFRLEQAAPRQDARREHRAPARQLTLLLVHPEAEALRPLICELAERGHRAVPAADAVQALEMAARLRFDAVFASPSIQDLDWPEFAARLKAHAPVTGWLASASRPAPPGVPSLPLQPSSHTLDDLSLAVEGTPGSPAPSIGL